MFDAWRSRLGLASQPTTVVVTAAGDVPADHAGLTRGDVPVVIATSRAGARRLASGGVPSGARVEVLSDAGFVEPERLVALLTHMGARLALCEGGPHLLAHLLGADAVDELFLTLAPQVLGRTAGGRHAWAGGGTRVGPGRRAMGRRALRPTRRIAPVPSVRLRGTARASWLTDGDRTRRGPVADLETTRSREALDADDSGTDVLVGAVADARPGAPRRGWTRGIRRAMILATPARRAKI